MHDIVATDYLNSADKSIHTVVMGSAQHLRVVYVYNHAGKYYRVFHSLTDLLEYLDTGMSSDKSFDTEDAAFEYAATRKE